MAFRLVSREEALLAPFLRTGGSPPAPRRRNTMSSEPARNLVHGLLLAVWAVVGVLVTLSALVHPATLLGAGAFWLWFVGFAVATTVLVARTGTPLGALVRPRRPAPGPRPGAARLPVLAAAGRPRRPGEGL